MDIQIQIRGLYKAYLGELSQGEVPYLDFIYVRPPLSLYVHSLPLFFPMPVLFERLLFYLSFALIVSLSTRSLQAYFDFQPIGISPAIFAGIAFACSVHNFPPMPWHTVDGLIFASAGVYLISRKDGFFPSYLALMFFLLSALCKQSFYPLIVLGPVALFLLKDREMAKKSTVAFTASIFLLFGSFRLGFPEWTLAMIRQTTGATSIKDLLEIGVYEYGKPLLLVFPLGFAIRRLQRDLILPYNWKYLPGSIYWFLFFGMLGLHVWKAVSDQTYIGPSFGFGEVFFLVAVGIGIRGTWINTKAYGMLLFMLVISWCAALSWGYTSPILYFTPVMFAFFLMLYEDLEFRVPRYFYGLVLVLLLWVFSVLYQFPYRTVPRSQLTEHVGDIFPALKGIQVGDPMYRKCVELDSFSTQYGKEIAILPSFPSAHLLLDANNPIGTDWAHNAEVNGTKFRDQLIYVLESEQPYVFLEKDKLDELNDESRYGSWLSRYVYENWDQVEEGEFFIVYKAKDRGISDIGG